jgi:nucleoid-associated protein YgaU
MSVIVLTIFMALPAWGQQYFMYSPQPATSEQKSASQDGILVQEIEIQKGDTLYALSRKFSGHGTYFPQILLFNSINNPNLIYAGKTLKVPVSNRAEHEVERKGTKPTAESRNSKTSGAKKTAAKTESKQHVKQSTVSSPASGQSTEISLSDLKVSGTEKAVATRSKKAAVIAKKKLTHSAAPVASSLSPIPAVNKSTSPAVSAGDAEGQKLFEAAVKAYRHDDCRTAIELLDRYLANNSGSAMAADANLYKADCYLKLSAQ